MIQEEAGHVAKGSDPNGRDGSKVSFETWQQVTQAMNQLSYSLVQQAGDRELNSKEKTFYRAQNVLNTQNYGIFNVIDKKWNTNYVSVEDKIRPLDDNLVSLMNVNAPLDIMKLMKFFKNE